MSQFKPLREGHVTITGQVDGKDVTLEGHVKDILINVEPRYENVSSVYSIGNQYRLVKDTDYSLFFTVVDNKAFTIDVTGPDISEEDVKETSSDVETEKNCDPRSDWKIGFDDGYAKGREDMRAEALISVVKELTKID